MARTSYSAVPGRAPVPRRIRLAWLPLLLALVLASLPAGPAAASSTVFVDGFESGTLSLWTAWAGAEVRGDHVVEGAYAVRLRGDQRPAFVMKRLAATVADVEISAAVSMSRTAAMTLLQAQTSSGTPIASVKLNASGRLTSLNNLRGTKATSTIALGVGGWHRLALRVQIGTSGTLQVTLDGAPVSQLSQTTNLGSSSVGRLQVGDRAKTNAEVVADDVTIADVAASPDLTPPGSPKTVTASPVTPTRVDIAWNAATDNRGVVRYELMRGGVSVGVSTGLAFSDVWAPPGTSVAYTVVAVDAAANRSSPSAPAGATTSAAPAPGTVIATDHFDRPDGGLGTADSGQPWTTDAQSIWGVESGLARILQGQDPGKTATAVDVGLSDRIRVEADITLSPTTNRANVGLSYHYGAPNMHMWAKLEVSPGHPDGLVTIGKQDPAGTTSLLASAHDVGLVNGATYHASVELDGPDVRFTVSGGNLTAPVRIEYSLTRAEQISYMGRTAAGLRIRLVWDEDDGRSRWNTFAVTAI